MYVHMCGFHAHGGLNSMSHPGPGVNSVSYSMGAGNLTQLPYKGSILLLTTEPSCQTPIFLF